MTATVITIECLDRADTLGPGTDLAKLIAEDKAWVGMFCDHCKTRAERDYLVSEYDGEAMRFFYAREHLTNNEGWSCTEGLDLCPKCAQGGAR